MFRLERWQQERLSSKKLGGRLEQEDTQIQAGSTRSVASQTVWLKFEAERDLHDVAYQLIRLRRKLGLPTQLPIHGPGGKQVMEQSLKNAENEQVIEHISIEEKNRLSFSLISQSAHADANGVFYYCLLTDRHKHYAPYNPYKLEIQPNGIEALSSPCYWTMSAFNITHVDANEWCFFFLDESLFE